MTDLQFKATLEMLIPLVVREIMKNLKREKLLFPRRHSMTDNADFIAYR